MAHPRVILAGQSQRAHAKRLVDDAPAGAVVTIAPPGRSVQANALMWSRLTDLADAKPEGREHTPEVWKMLAMHALGYESRFVMGLDGEPFPAGFRSSKLSKAQMNDLITFIHEYGDRHGVKWKLEA